MFPLQSFKGRITSMQTSFSMEVPNTDKECLKYLKEFSRKLDSLLCLALKRIFFSAKLLPMI